ncbi:SRPBCC family protein [Opitutia bacterium ISCC 51]|nr:SRPBCC family protein [Opitutae bacterium ISCC 51]QXD26829.1 SRPBCC family protein [Opitutae bacterium ISCC 52]
MPKFNAEKSIVVDVPLEKAFSVVRDFTQGPVWSPWVIAEPESKGSVSPDGMQNSWEGDIIGSGKMLIEGAEENQAIYYTLTFLKPWKAISPVSFLFEPEGSGTKLTWTMEGSMPFFLFFLTKMMGVFVGMDYERGLKMLKDYLETGEVPSKLAFNGNESFERFPYVGIKTTTTMEAVGPAMADDFGKLKNYFQGQEVNPDSIFSIYHKWDPIKGMVVYTTGLAVESAPESLPEGFVAGEFPACEAYEVTHTGPYRHLGNAWSSAMMHARAKVFKQSKKIHPFETYANNPETTPENELITNVYFPIA